MPFDRAVADFVAPDARRSARRPGLRVELVAPDQLPLRRVRLRRPGCWRASPECSCRCSGRSTRSSARPDRSSPGRSGRCGRTGTRPWRLCWVDLQHVLVGALAGQRQRVAGRDLRDCSTPPCCRPSRDREGLEVVEQSRVVGLVVQDVHPRDRGKAQRRAAGRVGQLDQHAALALVLGIVDGLDGEGLLGDVGREGQRARRPARCSRGSAMAAPMRGLRTARSPGRWTAC